jgi:type VI secretion system protein ImpL
MKFIFMLASKSALELLLPALGAMAALLIVFLLFSGKKERKPRRQSSASRGNERHAGKIYSDSAPANSQASPMVPRFLLLGAADSGKTSLLDGLRHIFSSHGRTWITDLASGVACWHLAEGEVLEVAGNLFGRPGNGAEEGWKSLLSHLQRNRPERPLDGIILALPSTYLTGDNALSGDDLQRQAAQAAKQLTLLRNQLGFCLPIYLVITKCDAIPGCATFVRTQLTPHLGEIFGWSTPYNLDAPFGPAWTAQAFAEINRALSGERTRFFARSATGPAGGSAARDDLFLFPARVSRLQGPLGIYLQEFLKNSSHRDGLLFRGIYFSGSAAHTSEAFDETRSAPNSANRVGFTADLFKQKIFPERGLARPVESAFAHQNTKVNVLRALCVAAALLLFSGAIFSWYRLSQAATEITRHLRQVHASLNQGRPERDAESAYSTIYAAQALSGRNFQSVFLPASLVDSLGPRVEEIMVPAFNQLVYPGLQTELERATGDLLRGTCDTSSENRTYAMPQPSQGANAAQSLSNFTGAFLELEDNIVLYNKLAPSGRGNGNDMMALAGFLSPKTFAGLRSRNTSGLDAIVRSSGGAPLNGCPWNRPAAAKLEMLATDVLRQSVHEDQLLGSLDALVGKINLLQENKLNTYDDLNGLLQSLGQVQNHLAAPDLQWIAWSQDGFQLPRELSQPLDRIFSRPAEKNVLLCDAAREKDSCSGLRELKSAIEAMGHEHFVKMRNLLLNASTDTTGPVVATTDAKLQLSKPAVELQTVLNNFLKLPFVAHEGTAHISDLKDGEQLFWDNQRLQAALQDKQAYDQFFGSQLANTSENLQDTFDEVGLSRLEANMVDSIAGAERFEALPTGDKLLPATINEARSFQAAAPSLEQVLQQFSELNFDDSYQNLLRVSTGHAFMVLARIDRAFDAQHLYWPPDGKFDAWTSKSLPSSAAYAIHGPEEMAGYLVSRRQDVEQYAAAAQPLVAFLQQHIGNPKQKPLLAKWQSIVSDLKNYQSAPAASGLGSVEDFLANGMDKTAPPECQAPPSAVASNLVYFVQVRHALERALVSRCRSLSNQSAFRQYNEFAQFFNQRLAGKFPFSPPASDPNAPEADPADVIDFFHQFDANAKAIRQGLQNSSAATKFLDQIEALRPLFASLLTGQSGAAPAFDFAPAFRVNRNHEINGNQIIEWNLQADGNTFRNFDPPTTGRWTYGEPVQVMLRWAKDSPQQPVPLSPATANAKTRTVIFAYHDPWSLLRMLAEHAAAPADLDRAMDYDPQTLVFTADQESSPKTAKGQPAPAKAPGAGEIVKVFIRLRIYAPGKTEALRITAFPVQAPSP